MVDQTGGFDGRRQRGGVDGDDRLLPSTRRTVIGVKGPDHATGYDTAHTLYAGGPVRRTGPPNGCVTLKTCRAASTCTLAPDFQVTCTQTTLDPAIGGDVPGGSRCAPTVSDGEPLSSPELRTQFMLVRALTQTAEAR
ncbi:hypothetical protein [Streptomyces hawaiiensis]|uniref:hypothetical protein n=1 Tax=Streptomyces hawaiiensis TaxID=67305 RepID=UPI003656DEDA